MGGDGAVTEGIKSSKAVGGDAVTVNVRCSNGSFSVQVALDSSVASFKSVLEENYEIPAGHRQWIYKGRILKDDQTLKSYGLKADDTVDLVCSFVPTTYAPAGTVPTRANTTPSVPGQVEGGTRTRAVGGTGLGGSPFSGLGLGGNGDMFGMQQQLIQDPNITRQIMGLTLVQNLLNNPDVMHNMMVNNPQMRDFINQNPELAHMFNDAAILRETMEVAKNPELTHEIMRDIDRAMSNIESSPEGVNMLKGMYEDVQKQLLPNATTMGGGDARNDLNTNPFAALLSGAQGGPARDQAANPTTTTGYPAPNTNPWGAGDCGGGANQNDTTTPFGIGWSQPAGGLSGLEGGTTPDPNSMSQHMQNLVSQIMQSLLSNPQFMNQILGLNPQMRSMLESNPQLKEMMQNPDSIRQLTSPETMQQMMALEQSFFSQGGRQQPTREAGQTGGTTVPLEEVYATQLAQLEEKGFFDAHENLRALTATAGNVDAAVERLSGNRGL